MSSIEESKRRVKAGLHNVKTEVDHDEILASLQQEIDQHNQSQRTQDSTDERHSSSLRFHFKSSSSAPRKRKHSSHHHRRHHRTHRRDDVKYDQEEEVAHPFRREPVEVDNEASLDSNAAFRESLFDALADDEGAAYWESVYSQPIHIYPRPNVKTAKGELEEMNDEDYAAYVQAKMWEKKNPHIVRERERKEKRQKEQEEERTRRREEFVRSKQRAAWEKAEKDGARRFEGAGDETHDGAGHEYVFDFEERFDSGSKGSTLDQRHKYREAWKQYLAAWDKLKHELLSSQDSSLEHGTDEKVVAERIPWPVLQTRPVRKESIEEFMQWITECQPERSKLQLLKSERVRWHPDKMQQRFRGEIGEETMRLVTGVFQVVDALYEHERSHEKP